MKLKFTFEVNAETTRGANISASEIQLRIERQVQRMFTIEQIFAVPGQAYLSRVDTEVVKISSEVIK